MKNITKKVMPIAWSEVARRYWKKHKHNVPFATPNLGSLNSEYPLNKGWGFERGLPIDRFYIEQFISGHSDVLRGHILSIGDGYYTNKFGDAGLIKKSDVLHVDNDPNATIIADLADAPHIPADSFDCFLFVQTLQLIYDVRAALETTYRIMKPGGLVLATFPGITPLKDDEWNSSWYWNFTAQSAQRLFEELFPKENIQVKVYGNALAATAFLQGLSVQDLSEKKLDTYDPAFPVLITVKALKPSSS